MKSMSRESLTQDAQLPSASLKEILPIWTGGENKNNRHLMSRKLLDIIPLLAPDVRME